MSKRIANFDHKEDRIDIFCRLKDVFYFTGDWVKLDIFQRKNDKLQQIWAQFKIAVRSHLLHQNKFSACKSADDCKQFFVPFVAVLQWFAENSAPNRESQKWNYSRVFWIKSLVFLCFYHTWLLTISKYIKW